MIREIKNKVTQSNSFIDESFDLKKLANYQLIFQFGTEGMLLSVCDTFKNKYIALEQFAFQELDDFTNALELIDVVKKESKLMSGAYKEVICMIVHNISTLVPSPLFDNQKKNLYLHFNASFDTISNSVMADDIKSLDAKNVFSVPVALKVKLEGMYSYVRFHHYSSTLIDSLLLENKNQTTKKVYVHVQNSHFEIVYIEGKKLIFYNTFKYKSAEDFMYYLMFIYDQLQLNPETIEVVLLGEIEKKSGLYTLAQKYIRHIKFGERNSNKDYSYQLQALPKHFYFTLFSDYVD